MNQLDELHLSEPEECPICFTTDKDSSLLITPCNHSACQSCLERVFLATSSQDLDYNHDDMESVHDCIVASCPTRARCPICRQYINMLDMKKRSCIPVKGSSSSSNAVYERNMCIEETPIAGMIFIPKGDKIGSMSIHFPPHSSSSINSTNEEDSLEHENASWQNNLPYINIENAYGHGTLDNGTPIPKRKYFEADSIHFDEKSKTFTGVIDWMQGEQEDGSLPSTLNGYSRLEVITQFSSDYRFIVNGCLIKKRYNPSDTTMNWTPLDGTWTVEYHKRRSGLFRAEPARGQIHVVNNAFHLYGQEFIIDFGKLLQKNHRKEDEGDQETNEDASVNSAKEDEVQLLWPDSQGYKAVVKSGLNLCHERDGPDVGGVIVWQVDDDHPQYNRIIWQRQTRAKPQEISVRQFGYSKSLCYERYREPEEREMPKYHGDSIGGNVFIQGYSVGYASYHFAPLEEGVSPKAYISYESQKCSLWPPLDDGSPIPSQVNFIETSFDESSRTFRGTIPWLSIYNTSWNGAEAWKYEMVFDSEFTCILSGAVTAIHNGESERIMSQFGHVLNYVNAAMVEKVETMIQDVINEHASASVVIGRPVAFRSVKDELTRRLNEEGIKPRTLNDVNHFILGAMDSSQYSIDYNLS